MRDITQVFEQAAAQLDYKTPFVCTSDLNLYDSMSALDVMDPKMDGCEVPLSHYIVEETELAASELCDEPKNVQDNHHRLVIVPPRPIPKHLKDIISPLLWDDLNISCVNMIVMEMMIRFQSFMDGNSVADTIYTCYYLHDEILQDMERNLSDRHRDRNYPTPLHQEIFTSQQTIYCISMLLVQLTSKIIQIVKHADIYEEEDFHMNLYGFRLASYYVMDKNDTTIMQSLESVYHTTLTMLSSLKEQTVDVHHILAALEFLWNLFVTCDKLSHLTQDNVMTTLNGILTTTQQSPSSPLQIILKNMRDGSVIAEVTDTKVIRQCFDSYANRPKTGNVPIRKVAFQSLKPSLEYLDQIYQHLKSKVCHVLLHGKTSLQRAQFIFGRLSKESLNILTRSLIVMNLFFDDLLFGQENLAKMILDDMKRFGVPGPLVTSHYGLEFIQKLCQPTYDILKLMMLNRNRQNIFMDAVILKVWSNLQYDANIVDTYFEEEHELGPSMIPFATKYVIAKTTNMMEHYLSLGVELKLFHSHHQLMTVYWYLDFLQSTHLTMVTSMKQHLEERKAMELQISLEEEEQIAIGTEPNRGKEKKNNKNIQKQAKAHMIPNADPSSTSEDLEDQCYRQYMNVKQLLYRGIFRFLSSLEQTGFVRMPQYSFTSNEICFEKRFEPFAQISQPPPLTFQDFKQGSDYSNIHPQTLISFSMNIFKDCKLLLSNLKKEIEKIDLNYSPLSVAELNHMMKVCVTNSIHLFKLSQCMNDDTIKNKNENQKVYKVILTVDPLAPFYSIQLD